MPFFIDKVGVIWCNACCFVLTGGWCNMVECMPFCIDGEGSGVTWWNACRFVLTGWEVV